jgi:hypothetical protein
VIGAGKGFVENPVVTAKSSRAVNVKGSANACGQIGQRHVFGVELFVTIFEVVHYAAAYSRAELCDWMKVVSITARPGE